MKLAFKAITCISIASILAASSFADTKSSITKTGASSQSKKETKVFGGQLNISRSTSLVDFQDGTRKDSMDYLTKATMAINTEYSVELKAAYSQDLRYSENSDFADTSLSLSKAPKSLGRYLLLGFGVSAVVPTSKDSYKRQSLQTALGTGLSWKLNPDRLIAGLEIAGLFTVGRNFHKYETALDGKVNNQYSSLQSLSISYDLKYDFSASLQMTHKNALSYQNSLKDSFEFSQEISYAANSNLSMAIGHTNDGSSLRANGYESNVALIDESTSMIYLSLTALY